MKQEKGITLIALVITIIVLLILAGVVISMLSGENGILTRASAAKKQTDLGNLSESIKLSAMTAITTSEEHTVTGENFKTEFEKDGYTLNEDGTVTYNNEKYAVTDKGAVKATIKELAKEEAVVYTNTKLTDSNNEQIVVPVGFKIKKDTQIEFDGEILVKGGIVVVAPDESEFVWVPVKDVSTMYGTDASGNKLGKIYKFTSTGYKAKNWIETDGVMSWINEIDHREPDYLSSTTDGDAVTGDSTKGIELLKSIVNLSGTDEEILSTWQTQLKKEYSDMIDSVKTNKGFYIGRYETSLESGKAQSKTGKESATPRKESANTWYGLYQKQKEYSKNNSIENNVGSSMIWGSQYDQMMIWMQDNGIDVTSTTPTNLEGDKVNKNTSQITGSEPKDKLNNIYDLLGDNRECTLAAMQDYARVARGPFCGDDLSPSDYANSGVYNRGNLYSSRITIYVK